MTKVQWAERLKKWRHDNQEHYAKTLLETPEKVNLYSIIPQPGVMLIMGDRGWGKSVLAYEMADNLHTRKSIPAIVHLPTVQEPMRKQVQKLLPSWIQVVKSRAEWPRNAFIIYDEAAQSAHARRTQSGDAVELDDLIGISRQRNQPIAFISHHSRKLDVNVITEVNRIIWKKPTYAHQMFERDEVSDFSLRAFQYFDTMRGGNKWTEASKRRAQRMSLVLDMDVFDFMQCSNGAPKWWSEGLSTIFSQLQRSAHGLFQA